MSENTSTVGKIIRTRAGINSSSAWTKHKKNAILKDVKNAVKFDPFIFISSASQEADPTDLVAYGYSHLSHCQLSY
jgi:hypothetical protein